MDGSEKYRVGDKARLLTFHQFRYIHFCLNEITVAPHWVSHIKSAFGMLLARCRLAAPFWTFHEDSSRPRQFPLQNCV